MIDSSYQMLFSTFIIAIFACLIQTTTSQVQSSYSGSLSPISTSFVRSGQTSGVYYYQAIQTIVYAGGKYTFRSNSSIDTYGYFYSGSFDPLNPSRNLIAFDDDSGGSGQFLFNVTLTYGGTYILVVTTYAPNVIGTFSVTALGPSTIVFSPLNPTTPAPTTTTSSPLVPSYYSGSLALTSGTFVRSGQTSGVYYYQAIQTIVYASGKYTFRSSSSIDTYGYFYSGSFDPLNPSRNLIAFDNDSGGSGQFLFNVTLTYGGTYILVVTTYAPSVIGAFSVTALGPATVVFSSLNPTTPAPTTTTSSPLIPSYYYGSLSLTSRAFVRPTQTSGVYYYQAIQTIVYASGKYTFRSNSSIDTYGYLYSGSFDPLNPSRNLIAFDDDSGGNYQFLLNVTLTYGGTYILVVTTYAPSVIGTFSVTALGPGIVVFSPLNPTTPAPTTTTSSPLVPSYYYSSLSSTDATFVRPGQTSGGYYYQAIQTIVYASGKYTFRSNSSLDTYGYFYSGSFDPLNPSRNLIAFDDDSGGNYQFLFNVTLTYAETYILVVTTYAPNITGRYAAVGRGPSQIYFSAFVPTTTSSPTTTSTSLLPSYYSSSLSVNSAVYARPGQTSRTFYYEAIRVSVFASGNYIVRSSSVLDTYGYLYSGSFDPLNPSQNLIASDDDSGGSGQFLLNVTLTYGGIYILVVTTYAPQVTGSYGVAALGPSRLYFAPYQTTTTAPTTTTTVPLVPSSYSDSLSSSSGQYVRPGQTSGDFYYQAIQITVYTSGKYTFRSSSSLDTYGYFYSGSFDPSYPSQNLIASDDDSGGSGQFLLNVTLTYGGTYTLVVTTYAPDRTGYYTVYSLGPAIVSWTAISPSFISQLDAVKISCIAIGCVVFIGLILSACACACRRKRQRIINRTAVYSMANEKTQSMETTESQMPYVIPIHNVYGSSDEKPTLSNN